MAELLDWVALDSIDAPNKMLGECIIKIHHNHASIPIVDTNGCTNINHPAHTE